MPSPKRIGKIEFGLLSPKEIRTMSVRKIIWADTYDDDGFPYPQGLMDLNLGVIDPGLRCKTCNQKASEMSFSVRCSRCAVEYCGHNLRGLFARTDQLFRPRFHRMLFEILRFNRAGRAWLR